MGNRTDRAAKHWLSNFGSSLPPHIRVLYITNRQRTGGWLAEAFAHDSATEVQLEEAMGSAAGLARLREEAFDAVLVSHEPGELDALELIEGYRAGGADEPIIVLGHQSEQELAALCFEVGADAYVCVNATTTRTLIWMVARAIHRCLLERENRRLAQAEQQRLQREHDEAERLLVQQRALIQDLVGLRLGGGASASTAGALPAAPGGDRPSSPPPASLALPSELVQHYRDLLRTYLIMGFGNLGAELARLAELLASAGVSARQAMSLHLHVLEDLIHGLGTRSTRHVMARADLLVLEIMIHLADGYRRRYQDCLRPPVQRLLPGLDSGTRKAA